MCHIGSQSLFEGGDCIFRKWPCLRYGGNILVSMSFRFTKPYSHGTNLYSKGCSKVVSFSLENRDLDERSPAEGTSDQRYSNLPFSWWHHMDIMLEHHIRTHLNYVRPPVAEWLRTWYRKPSPISPSRLPLRRSLPSITSLSWRAELWWHWE